MSVYGLETGTIDEKTKTIPHNSYGRSKLEAEMLISPLQGEYFKVSILRPPMVYGRGCRGNYQKLSQIAQKTPFFPSINNQRSMIYIENLLEFVKYVIDNQYDGLLFPQNDVYVNTSQMVKMIAEIHQRKIWMTKILNPIISLFKHGLLKKIFGNLVYSRTLPSIPWKYNIVDFEKSILKSEEGVNIEIRD